MEMYPLFENKFSNIKNLGKNNYVYIQMLYISTKDFGKKNFFE
jgi:hypothetical protein